MTPTDTIICIVVSVVVSVCVNVCATLFFQALENRRRAKEWRDSIRRSL